MVRALCHAAIALIPGLAMAGGGAADYVVAGRLAGPDGMWDYAAVDNASHRLYLAQTDHLSILDLTPGGTWSRVGVTGAMWHGVLPIFERGLVLATNGADHTLALFEAKSLALVHSIRTSSGPKATLTGREAAFAVLADPDALALEPRSGLVAVVNGGSGDVVLIDLDQRRLVDTLHIGGKLEFAVTDGRGRLFVNVETTHAIAVVDVARRTVIQRWPLAGCEEPTGLAYDTALDLLISVCGNGIVKFVGAADGTERASLKVGRGADAVLLDAQRRRVFVPSAEDGRLYIFDIHEREIRLIQTLKTEHGVRLGALDAVTGTLYLPAARLRAPIPPYPWPSAQPGTFHLLVITPPAAGP